MDYDCFIDFFLKINLCLYFITKKLKKNQFKNKYYINLYSNVLEDLEQSICSILILYFKKK